MRVLQLVARIYDAQACVKNATRKQIAKLVEYIKINSAVFANESPNTCLD
jgi:hypothetical protein